MKSPKMGNITPEEAGGGKTVKVTVEGNLSTSQFGGNVNTTLTKQSIEALERLTQDQALAQVYEELRALLVVYQNLGGVITALTLPVNMDILGRRHVIILPALQEYSGTYSLYIPEKYRLDPG